VVTLSLSMGVSLFIALVGGVGGIAILRIAKFGRKTLEHTSIECVSVFRYIEPFRRDSQV